MDLWQGRTIFFGIEFDKLYLYRQGQERELVNTFAGEILSYAASRTQGYFIFVDSYNSILMTQINSDGTVASTWTGGTILDGEDTIVTGDVLASGIFAIGTSSGKLLSVDIAASITNKSWVLNELPAQPEPILWIGKVSANENYALLVSGNDSGRQYTLQLVDMRAGSVVESRDLSGLELSVSKSGDDHLIAFNGSENRVYIGGSSSIQDYLLPDTNSRSPRQK